MQHICEVFANLDKLLRFQYLSPSSFKFVSLSWKPNTELHFSFISDFRTYFRNPQADFPDFPAVLFWLRID